MIHAHLQHGIQIEKINCTRPSRRTNYSKYSGTHIVSAIGEDHQTNGILPSLVMKYELNSQTYV
jgi:hypothetical protein